MISAPSAARIWIVAGVDGYASRLRWPVRPGAAPAERESVLGRRCTSSADRRGDKIKILWYSGDGLALFYKRLSTGIFTWPQVKDGTVQLSSAQLSMLLEGIDWRKTHRTAPAPQDPDRTHPTVT